MDKYAHVETCSVEEYSVTDGVKGNLYILKTVQVGSQKKPTSTAGTIILNLSRTRNLSRKGWSAHFTHGQRHSILLL